jgi:hypothetical protein
MSTDPVDFLLRAAFRLQRPEIERLTEGLIAGLDVIDGDPDLEPEQDQCLAGDDGCAAVWRMGQKFWGSAAKDAGI